jgi:hypothetical protein
MKATIEIGMDSLERCFDLVPELTKGATHQELSLPNTMFDQDLAFPAGWRGGIDKYTVTNSSENYEYTITRPKSIEQKCSIDYNTGSFIIDMIVALGSAGAFTAVYRIICKWLDRNKNRKLIIKTRNAHVAIVGHSIPDERELLDRLKLNL